MANTPNPPKGQNVETETYSTPAKHDYGGGSEASYTPDYAADPYVGGKDGGKASFNNPPQVVVGGASEVGALPKAFTGDFGIGDDKNVSTPVSG